jgi:hypothetical protein
MLTLAKWFFIIGSILRIVNAIVIYLTEERLDSVELLWAISLLAWARMLSIEERIDE